MQCAVFGLTGSVSFPNESNELGETGPGNLPFAARIRSEEHTNTTASPKKQEETHWPLAKNPKIWWNEQRTHACLAQTHTNQYAVPESLRSPITASFSAAAGSHTSFLPLSLFWSAQKNGFLGSVICWKVFEKLLEQIKQKLDGGRHYIIMNIQTSTLCHSFWSNGVSSSLRA